MKLLCCLLLVSYFVYGQDVYVWDETRSKWKTSLLKRSNYSQAISQALARGKDLMNRTQE